MGSATPKDGDSLGLNGQLFQPAREPRQRLADFTIWDKLLLSGWLCGGIAYTELQSKSNYW
jgi:hypothetical protein